VDRGDKGTKIRGSKIESLAEVQVQAIKRVYIRLTDRHGMAEELPRLREVFLRHPGSTTVAFTVRMDSFLEAETTPLPHLTVTPSERLVADVEELLGKGTVFLLS
jgi:DNA polymerase-3 subunit alpha